MKQLSALGARRHAFFRGPRRMRTLGGRLEDPDILGPGAYGYYGGKMAAAYEHTLDLVTAASMLHTIVSIQLCRTDLYHTDSSTPFQISDIIASRNLKAWSGWFDPLTESPSSGSEVLIKTKLRLVALQVTLTEHFPSLKQLSPQT